jgi:hypothetical protein
MANFGTLCEAFQASVASWGKYNTAAMFSETRFHQMQLASVNW